MLTGGRVCDATACDAVGDEWASVDDGLSWNAVTTDAGYGRKSNMACNALASGLLFTGGRDYLTGDSHDVFVAYGSVWVMGPDEFGPMVIVVILAVAIPMLTLLVVLCYRHYRQRAANNVVSVPLLRLTLADHPSEATSMSQSTSISV